MTEITYSDGITVIVEQAYDDVVDLLKVRNEWIAFTNYKTSKCIRILASQIIAVEEL